MKIARTVGCRICQNTRFKVAEGHTVEADYADIDSVDESSYTEAERAALGYVETFCVNAADGHRRDGRGAAEPLLRGGDRGALGAHRHDQRLREDQRRAEHRAGQRGAPGVRLRRSRWRDGGRSMEDVSERLALRALVDEYAAAVDAQGRRPLRRRCSRPTASWSVFEPERGRPSISWRGPDELREVMKLLSSYSTTFHLMANHTCELDGDTRERRGLLPGAPPHRGGGGGRQHADGDPLPRPLHEARRALALRAARRAAAVDRAPFGRAGAARRLSGEGTGKLDEGCAGSGSRARPGPLACAALRAGGSRPRPARHRARTYRERVQARKQRAARDDRRALPRAGRRVVTVLCDVRDHEAVQEAVGSAVGRDRQGRRADQQRGHLEPDGRQPRALGRRLAARAGHQPRGSCHVGKAVARHMIERGEGGAIINIASAAGLKAFGSNGPTSPRSTASSG